MAPKNDFRPHKQILIFLDRQDEFLDADFGI